MAYTQIADFSQYRFNPEITTSGQYSYADGFKTYEMTDTNPYTFEPNTDGTYTKVFDTNAQKTNSFLPEMSTMGYINAGANLAQGIASLYSAFQNNSLARKTFNFNKDMMQKNYELAKDAYDRKVRRTAHIDAQLSGMSRAEAVDFVNRGGSLQTMSLNRETGQLESTLDKKDK